ncbi:MAG: hypothetical protein ABW022_16565 [Actinoplanes sp.]
MAEAVPGRRLMYSVLAAMIRACGSAPCPIRLWDRWLPGVAGAVMLGGSGGAGPPVV